MQIIEAVPNISEAQDYANLARILGDVRAVLGNVRLLHVDSNADANRTVLTLAGDPEQVVRVCFMLFRACKTDIDMRFHEGAHPRLGAVDVCPLIPVKDITLVETAQFADTLAKCIAKELNIPVYLYEENARSLARRNLAFIRQGEYESLPEKLRNLPPDYGPRTFSAEVAHTGASVIGARNFLIAFNMSLNTQEVKIAQEIATVLRERNGGLPGVKAIGWYMPGYQCAQVSCNLTDFHKTSLATLFETCKKEANKRGLQITGSEMIGLVPQQAILAAGQFYSPDEKNETVLISTATERLLLNKIQPFVPSERILEKCLLIQ